MESKIAKWIFLLIVFMIVMFLLFNPSSGYGPKLLAKLSLFYSETYSIENPNSIPSTEVSQSFSELYKLFAKYKYSSDKECFVSLDAITSDLDDFIFSLQMDGDIMKISIIKEGTLINYGSLDGLKTCAVYGPNAVDNFYNRWIDGNSKQGIEYNEYNEIVIYKKGFSMEGNRRHFNIRYLYKADDEHICVIPTYNYFMNNRCFSGSKGLSNNCGVQVESIAQSNLCGD